METDDGDNNETDQVTEERGKPTTGIGASLLPDFMDKEESNNNNNNNSNNNNIIIIKNDDVRVQQPHSASVAESWSTQQWRLQQQQ